MMTVSVACKLLSFYSFTDESYQRVSPSNERDLGAKGIERDSQVSVAWAWGWKAVCLLCLSLQVLIVLPPPQSHIVVEYGRANGLFSSVLSDHVFVDPSLQVSWIELRDAEDWLCEHGASSRIECGIIAAREARVEIRGSTSDSRRCGGCECTRTGAPEE